MNISISEDSKMIFKFFKPILCIAIGYFLLNYSIESAQKLISIQDTDGLKGTNLEELYFICVAGGAGLAIFIYSSITVTLKFIEIFLGLMCFLAQASRSALAILFKRFVVRSKAKDE